MQAHVFFLTAAIFCFRLLNDPFVLVESNFLPAFQTVGTLGVHAGNALELSDSQFLVASYNISNYEIKASKLAHRMTNDKNVRKFSSVVRTDQEIMNKQLLAILMGKRIVPPSEKVSGKWKEKFKYLDNLMGKDFDRNYAADHITGQVENIALYNSIIKTSADPAILQFAAEGIRKFQLHEDSAKSLLVHINIPPRSSW